MARGRDIPIRVLLAEETEVDFEHGLQQAHVRALVETDLVLP